ncbi:M6 family metalloprotease domain-containing protein [Elusimicrobiota bacterium]
MTGKIRIIIIGAVFAVQSITLHSAPSYEGAPGPQEYINRQPEISAQAYKAAVTGNKKVAVILVDFLNAGSNTSGQNHMNADDVDNFGNWFKSGSRNFEDYYDEASYGQLELEVTFAVQGGTKTTLTGGVDTPFEIDENSMGYYGADEANYADRLSDLIKQALDDANAVAGINISTATFDYVAVAHAGYGNESTNKSGDIWSVSVGWTEAGDTYGFDTGMLVPARESGELSPFGVICHEFGHQLGLPDIYALDTGETRVGKYALMDSGTWNNNGATPPHLCSWSKAYLNWLTPKEIEKDVDDQVINRYYLKKSRSVYKFVVPQTDELEYFLLSYRAKEGSYDSKLPDKGPVFIHVDESIATKNNIVNNTMNDTSQEHPGVDIVGSGVWNIYDVFTATVSNSYNGNISGITVYGFSAKDNFMSFNATIASFEKSFCIKEEPVNYPNPVMAASETTISFKLSKPENENTIRIYTPAGELVKTIRSEDIKTTYIQDDEVVYQAKWNLCNEAGNKVTSGIYIYQVESDDKKETGRMAIIRD